MQIIQLPHISRIFSAQSSLFVSKIALWGVLSALLTINILAVTDERADQPSPYIFSAPGAQFRLLVMSAQSLWNGKKTEEAKSLLSVAQTVASPSVLGATQPSDLISSWEASYAQTNILYQKWLAITVEKPNYRDAYLVASALAHNMGKETEAMMLRQQAAGIDPLFGGIQQ